MSGDLVERLEGAEGGSRKLDYAIKARLETLDDYWSIRVAADWSTSLDAALALAERVLGKHATPGVMLEQRLEGREVWGGWVDCKVGTTRFAATPALALCAAIIRAKAEPNPAEGGEG